MSGIRGVPDPYRELGVPRGASEEQVKAAHRRLAKRYHPDAPNGDQIRFLAVQEAYLLLSDPIRRRDWDSRHAPGPVRATERPVAPRPPVRPASRPTASPPRRPEDFAGRPPRPTGPPDPASRTTTSGRDPATRSTTWSAQGVPWWEDFRADGVTRGGGAPPGGGAPSGGAPTEPGAPASASADQPPKAPGANQPPLTGTGFSRRPNVSAQPPAGQPPTGGPPPGAGQPPSSGPTPGANTGAGDIYSRSSGAAWSSAARRHFRKDDADLPRGGAFRYRGTQVVTGAEARRDAEADARRSTMQPPAARPSSTPPRPVPSQPADPAATAGLMSRLRKLLGGS